MNEEGVDEMLNKWGRASLAREKDEEVVVKNHERWPSNKKAERQERLRGVDRVAPLRKWWW